MSFGITKTVPKAQGMEMLDSFYNASRNEFDFHMAGKPTKLKVGDYVYTIYDNLLYGRLEIIRFVEGETNPKSGKPRTLIFVKCPGEKLPSPIPWKSHRGTRYTDGEFWK